MIDPISRPVVLEIIKTLPPGKAMRKQFRRLARQVEALPVVEASPSLAEALALPDVARLVTAADAMNRSPTLEAWRDLGAALRRIERARETHA